MAFSLRLPPDLDRQARARAEQIGVPLNGLICFALDLYLRDGGATGRGGPVIDSLDFQNSSRLSYGGMPLKRVSAPPPSIPAKSALKPALKASAASFDPSLPPGPGASKSDRRAYTEYMRLARKNS